MRRFSDSILLVIVGAALGPAGLNVLSFQALSYVDPAMPVALVALGVLVGLGVGGLRRRDARVLAAAGTDAILTGVAVAASALVVLPMSDATGTLPYWSAPAVLGICAAPSLALRPGEPESLAGRIALLDAVIAVAAGGAALAILREPSAAAAGYVLIQAAAVSVVITLAASLLIRASTSEVEQRVFTAALLLLLGGAADYLSLSSLLSGVIAGMFLQWGGGAARDAVSRDILHFQRPLVVLVLIVAGAHVMLPTPWLTVAAAFVLFRTVAKLAAAWAAGHLVGPMSPSRPGLSLLSPGILGIAFALNVARAVGGDAEPLLAAVAVGAIGCDLIARIAYTREAES